MKSAEGPFASSKSILVYEFGECERLEVKALNQSTGSHSCGMWILAVSAGSRMCLMENGMGQDDAPQMHHGVSAGRVPAASHSTESICSSVPPSSGQGLASLVRRGVKFFSSDRGENCVWGWRRRNGSYDPSPYLRPVSRVEADAEPAWR